MGRLYPWRTHLQAGQVIPACPLALDENGKWSERHQRALVRYYLAAGAGGLAVGVHSTQFAIREEKFGLLQPLLELVSETASQDSVPGQFVLISGICGETQQALREAQLAKDLGYHCGLVSLAGLSEHSDEALIDHCRTIAETIPIIGFYLQPAVGGRRLGFRFWSDFADIESAVAVKIAPFNRYASIDVVRAIVAAGRHDLAFYTGNDDNIIADLLTPFRLNGVVRYFAGGLLGQWGVWTKTAVECLRAIQRERGKGTVSEHWLEQNVQLTDANAAVFDAANSFAGCIPGIHEVLRRQGLMPSIRCLDPMEVLSPGQADEISRVIRDYPHLTDDEFVAEHLDQWLA